MTDRPLEVLLHHMPVIAVQADDEWVSGFARSIMRQARNASWHPSPKQEAVMRRLVSELFTETDSEVIEE